MDDTPIEFVSELPGPAPRTNRSAQRGAYRSFFEALRARPREWAKFPAQGTASIRGGAAANITRGLYAGISPGEFEAVSRSRTLFVRFVGDQS